MSALPPPSPPSPPRRSPPLSERVQVIIDKHKILSVIVILVGLGIAAAAWSAIQNAYVSPGSPGSPSGGSNRAAVTSCEFDEDGWVEASGTVVRAEGTKPGIVVNLLVNGVYVDRDYIYDAPVGETQYWSIQEPDVSRGACSVDLD